MTGFVINFLTMNQNPAEAFARWMSDKREKLGITLDVLEERTGIKKQHLSTLERAAAHSLTGKPVIPKRPTVEKIAKGLEASVDDALEAAGYQSNRVNTKLSEVDEEFAALFDESATWSKETRDEALDMAKTIFKRYKEREKAKKLNQGGKN